MGAWFRCHIWHCGQSIFSPTVLTSGIHHPRRGRHQPRYGDVDHPIIHQSGAEGSVAIEQITVTYIHTYVHTILHSDSTRPSPHAQHSGPAAYSTRHRWHWQEQICEVICSEWILINKLYLSQCQGWWLDWDWWILFSIFVCMYIYMHVMVCM